jgi:hypothetical protein
VVRVYTGHVWAPPKKPVSETILETDDLGYLTTLRHGGRWSAKVEPMPECREELGESVPRSRDASL